MANVTAPLLTGSHDLQARLQALSHIVTLQSRPDGCRGLFACDDIAAGQLIFEEVPLAYMSKASQQHNQFQAKVAAASARLCATSRSGTSSHPAALSTKDVAITNLSDIGVCSAPGWHPSDAIAAVRDLQPSCPADQPLRLTHLSNVIATNAAGAAFAADLESGIGMSCLLLVFSMMNHSCSPNVSWVSSWSPAETSTSTDAAASHCDAPPVGHPRFQVYALHGIPAGTELRISYIPVNQRQQVRMDDLRARYGFSCDCPRCSTRHDDTIAMACMACGDDGAVYGGRWRCSACGAEWMDGLRNAAIDSAAWAPESRAPLLEAARSSNRNEGSEVARRLLSSFHSDLLWWLDEDPCTRTLAAAVRWLHISDVRLLQLLSKLRDDAIDHALGAAATTTAAAGTPSARAHAEQGDGRVWLTLRLGWELGVAVVHGLLSLNGDRSAAVKDANGDASVKWPEWRRPEEIVDVLLAAGDAALLFAAETTAPRAFGTSTIVAQPEPSLPWCSRGLADSIRNIIAPADHRDPANALHEHALNLYQQAINVSARYSGGLMQRANADGWGNLGRQYLAACREATSSSLSGRDSTAERTAARIRCWRDERAALAEADAASLRIGFDASKHLRSIGT